MTTDSEIINVIVIMTVAIFELVVNANLPHL